MTTPKIAQRLREALAELDVTQADVARRTGRNPSTVSHWIKGSRTPPADTVEDIAAALGIRAAWLSHGDGPMVDVPQPPAPTTPTPRTRKPRVKKHTLPGPVKARTPKRAPHARAVG